MKKLFPNFLPSFTVKLYVISVKLCVPLLFCVPPLLLLSCQPTPATPPTPITQPTVEVLQIGVTGSAAGIIDLITPPTNTQFTTANTETLIGDLENGRFHAILIHHLPANLPNWFNPVALDGLVIVVHPDLPINELSRAEVQGIYNGRIQNWSTVGGPDLSITLISREQGAGTRSLFVKQIMAEQRVNINAQVQASDATLLTSVANTPGAIGYSMMGSSVNANVKVLAIDGMQPTPTTTANQTYPLTTPLYFVTANAAEPTGELRTFLARLQSDVGQVRIGGSYGRVR